MADQDAIEAEIRKLRDASKANVQTKTSKTISAEDVKTGLQDMKEMVMQCGDNRSLSVSFNIDETGKPQDIRSTGGNLQNTDAEKCILTVIENYQFPKAEKPVKNIKYRFRL